MHQNYNNKDKKDITQLIQPKTSEQIKTPEHSLIKICLGTKKISPKIIKNRKPKEPSKINSLNNLSSENKISTTEIKLNTSKKINDTNSNIFKDGPWSNEEHEKFIEGILKYENKWKDVQEVIKTRSSTQIRSHAQKFFKRIKNVIQKEKENIDINGKIKLMNNIFNIILPKQKVNKLNKYEKKRLLNVIVRTINIDGNSDLKSISEIDIDELEKINYENNIIDETNSNINLNLFNPNWKKNLNQKKILIGKKRKLDEPNESKDKLLSFKKEESSRSSSDLYCYKLSDMDNNDYLNLNDILGIYENFISIERNINDNDIDNNYENNITNNFMNFTNNIINNKIVYNICNKEIFDNKSNQYLYINDKNDLIYNENIENFNFTDKTFFNGNKFDKINCKINCKINNESENNDELDPFLLNFKGLSNENLISNENERQMSFHEYSFSDINQFDF